MDGILGILILIAAVIAALYIGNRFLGIGA